MSDMKYKFRIELENYEQVEELLEAINDRISQDGVKRVNLAALNEEAESFMKSYGEEGE